MTFQPVIRTLEAAAAHGDLTDRVYRRLFALHPEMEAQFVRDKDGSVRGELLGDTWTATDAAAWATLLKQLDWFATHPDQSIPVPVG
jgi:hemoglobin-like flavoprotein